MKKKTVGTNWILITIILIVIIGLYYFINPNLDSRRKGNKTVIIDKDTVSFNGSLIRYLILRTNENGNLIRFTVPVDTQTYDECEIEDTINFNFSKYIR
jgi:hypothetical protein